MSNKSNDVIYQNFYEMVMEQYKKGELSRYEASIKLGEDPELLDERRNPQDEAEGIIW